MAYQINLTGQEIDERLQNVGTAEDVAAADGTLYARISKNADDVDELNDTVLHIQDAQTATDKTVTQHTSDISTLQRAVSNNKTRVENVEKVVNQHTTTLKNHETRQTIIEKVVSGTQGDVYFTKSWLSLVFNDSSFNGNIDNVEVRLYRWSGNRYAQFEMFTRNRKGVSQESIGYKIILKQEKENGANIRMPYIHYNDDGTEERLCEAVPDAFGGRISYNRYKKRRWRIQAFLNNKPITAPFDFRVSVDNNNNVSLTKGGMMRSVPASRQVKYDGYYDVNKWINCEVGEELDLNYRFFNEDLGLIRRKFPNPGDVMVENASSHTVPRGVIISVFQDTPGSYCILWSNGESIYEIGIDLDTNEYGGYNCYSPAKKLSDNIYGYVSKMNSGTLRDLYVSAGAVYNEQTGFYELNGLTDITEEQMRIIYEKTWGWWLHLPSLNGFGSALPRTNIPCPDYKIIAYAANISLNSVFAVSGNDDNLEVVNLRALYMPTAFDEIKIVDFNWAFQEDKKIREVQGIMNVTKARSDLNIGGNIETINIKGLKVNIKFYNSQRLSKESVLYMINNSEATTTITIGLNKAVYDVMKDDADIIAALAQKTNITLIQNT